MRVKNNAVLGDFVYSKMKTMILTGQLKCGERIQEREIEAKLCVSRTPVREAVRRLSNEGIVVLYPNRYAEVITFTEEAVQELGLVRVTLDALSAELAILHGSNQDFNELEELASLCHKAKEQGNLQLFLEADADFHTKMVELSRNQLLINLQKNISLLSLVLQINQADNCPCDIWDTTHISKLCSAIKQRDNNAANQAIREYLIPLFRLDTCSAHALIV